MPDGVEREGIILSEFRLAWDSLEPFPNIISLELVYVKSRLKSFLISLMLSSES